MPRRDGTGPIGMGAMTGRRAGFCNGERDPRQFVRGFGGYGCQRGYKRQLAQMGRSSYLPKGGLQNVQDSEERG